MKLYCQYYLECLVVPGMLFCKLFNELIDSVFKLQLKQLFLNFNGKLLFSSCMFFVIKTSRGHLVQSVAIKMKGLCLIVVLTVFVGLGSMHDYRIPIGCRNHRGDQNFATRPNAEVGS